MGLLYIEKNNIANFVFGLSLLALVVSLTLSLIEVQLSTKSLNTQLDSIEENDE